MTRASVFSLDFFVSLYPPSPPHAPNMTDESGWMTRMSQGPGVKLTSCREEESGGFQGGGTQMMFE